MPMGQVKWFNNAKGFGFILPEDESEDYFVHYSSIVMDGYKTLKAGQAVSFEMIDGPKVHMRSTSVPSDRKMVSVRTRTGLETFPEPLSSQIRDLSKVSVCLAIT